MEQVVGTKEAVKTLAKRFSTRSRPRQQGSPKPRRRPGGPRRAATNSYEVPGPQAAQPACLPKSGRWMGLRPEAGWEPQASISFWNKIMTGFTGDPSSLRATWDVR